MDAKSEIREFLTSRRARISPEQAGLRTYGTGPRRIPGLRREEAARAQHRRRRRAAAELSDLVGELSTRRARREALARCRLTRFMTHIAMQQADEHGNVVTSGDQVSDADCAAAPATPE